MREPQLGSAAVPDAVRGIAQSRTPEEPTPAAAAPQPEGLGFRYRLGEGFARQGTTRLYQRKAGDPLYRPLAIYARDPGVSQLEGAIAEVSLQYEPLAPGPVGSVIEVDSRDAEGVLYPPAELDAPEVLLGNGYRPSLSLPQFHQQMVYAVAMLTYDHFKVALGRNVDFAFDNLSADSTRLRLRPFGAVEPNAWYDRRNGEIVFGYFVAKATTPIVEKGKGKVYTSLSHDIITHEMSHALLDGLRARFLEPTHPDVLAFHEAFADLVAFFQHFAYDDAVRAALVAARGSLAEAGGLTRLGEEFGRALGLRSGALRTLAGAEGDTKLLHDEASARPHERGQVLARAVYDAFEVLYRRRTRRFLKLATGGTGVLPPGDLPTELLALLAAEASKLAEQLLSICIRALDYCPPVDILFGDYLRALITADHDLVPDDRFAYREALIRSFGEHHIFGHGTSSMTEDGLLWNGPQRTLPDDRRLSLASLKLTNDLTEPADRNQLYEMAGVLGRLVSDPQYASEFGVISPISPAYDRNSMQLPVVESIRIARRIGPKRQVTLDIVAEVTQKIIVRESDMEFPFYGGATVILDAEGRFRFVIRKRVDHAERQREQREYMESNEGRQFWKRLAGRFVADAASIPRALCEIHR